MLSENGIHGKLYAYCVGYCSWNSFECFCLHAINEYSNDVKNRIYRFNAMSWSKSANILRLSSIYFIFLLSKHKRNGKMFTIRWNEILNYCLVYFVNWLLVGPLPDRPSNQCMHFKWCGKISSSWNIISCGDRFFNWFFFTISQRFVIR